MLMKAARKVVFLGVLLLTVGLYWLMVEHGTHPATQTAQVQSDLYFESCAHFPAPCITFEDGDYWLAANAEKSEWLQIPASLNLRDSGKAYVLTFPHCVTEDSNNCFRPRTISGHGYITVLDYTIWLD